MPPRIEISTAVVFLALVAQIATGRQHQSQQQQQQHSHRDYDRRRHLELSSGQRGPRQGASY